MFAYAEGQSAELKLFHQRTGALTIKGYKQAIEYLLDVLPRTAEVEEYAILNAMWESNYPDIKRKVRNTDSTVRSRVSLISSVRMRQLRKERGLRKRRATSNEPPPGPSQGALHLRC